MYIIYISVTLLFEYLPFTYNSYQNHEIIILFSIINNFTSRKFFFKRTIIIEQKYERAKRHKKTVIEIFKR